jgi:hypothetical protein
MDIIASINAYLLTKLTPYSTIFQDAFPYVGTEEIICRRDPSPAVETRYLDGSRQGAFNFSYYAKSTDMQKAFNQLGAIITALDLPGMTPITGVLMVKIEPATTPVFVNKTENLEFIYTAAFRLEYFVRRAS